MARKQISLTEATVSAMYQDLKDKTNDVEGVMDGVLVITDPKIDTEEYQELIDRAKEIIDDTPEGEIPFDDEYIGQYVQLCPVCGSTFVEDHILEAGDKCPICFEEPDAFTLIGQIQGEDDVMASATDGILEEPTEEEEEEETDKEENNEEENIQKEREPEETERLSDSKEINGGNKLQEKLLKEIKYISQEELDKIPNEYKTTIGRMLDAQESFRGENRENIAKLYTDQGYTEDDYMILTNNEVGTLLKPVKVKN